MINEIVEIGSSFLEIYLFYTAIGLLFSEEEKPRKVKIIAQSLILLGIVLYLNSFQLYSWMPFLIFPVYLGWTSSKMYNVKFKYTLALVLFYSLVIYIIDFISVTFLSILFGDFALAQSVLYSKSIERIIYISMCKIILLFVYYIWYRNYKKLDLYLEGYKIWVLITCCGFAGGIFLAKQTMVHSDLQIAVLWLFLVIIIILLMVVFCSYMVRKVEKQNYEFAKARNELLEDNYTNLKNAYELSAKISHDYKHHIRAIQSLIYEEDLTGLKEYIDNLELTQFNINEKKWTGDSAVNFIINNKINECSKYAIQFEANVDFPVDSNIKTNDMVTILANLLDNAIEACNQIDLTMNRKVRLIIRRINSMLVIKVENTCFQSPKMVDKKFITNKKNKQEHGWGLISVEDTARKYEGILRCSFDKSKHLFETTVSLTCKKNDF